MDDDLEAPTDASFSLPDCPLCGRAVATVTVHGPATAVAAPCGCRTPPEVLLVDADTASDDIGLVDTDVADGTERDSTPDDG